MRKPLRRAGLLTAILSPLPVILGALHGDAPVKVAAVAIGLILVPLVGYLGYLGHRAAVTVDRPA
ncbi:hypothetical protein K7640_10670 [Micromonospora sp. PLK6-60]|uniref:hypothetical protein n=1 Tax=Micromonospora sp. PLK6-60 TaxID=2873383 RepID=UPI001CA647ED|nr:hypothetical protein [Micromonospora sp. PLK6-60]MBY8872302.1 hypothetical protein [Micromonospora sp. PLK6-60]